MKSAFGGKDGGSNVPAYNIVISEQTLNALLQYKSDIASGRTLPGDRLKEALEETGIPLAGIETQDFIQALLATKQPLIFAESQIRGDGTDWTHRELALLGDINITMQAKAYDNGAWKPSDKIFGVHAPPLDVLLMFTPGALLDTGKNFEGASPDYTEVVANGRIDQEKYNALIERRLLPLFSHANACAEAEGRDAVITLPGIGCDAFAGDLRGQMGAHLNTALQALLEKHAEALKHISLVYFDPFGECSNAQKDFGSIIYRVRPAMMNKHRPQLSAPQDFAEKGDDFTRHRLCKIVAWDHVSFPGNDFFGNSRATDDGVSAAATNSMELITGLRGDYAEGRYAPPKGYGSWKDVVEKNGIRLLAKDNVKVVTNDAGYMDLSKYEARASTPPAAPKQNFG